MDLQGVLGIDGDVRNGFDSITVTYDIDADASRDDIAAIVAQSQKALGGVRPRDEPTTVRVELALNDELRRTRPWGREPQASGVDTRPTTRRGGSRAKNTCRRDRRRTGRLAVSAQLGRSV